MKHKVFSVEFVNPHVGNKGAAVYFTDIAESCEDILAKAKANSTFMAMCNRASNAQYPPLDRHFRAYETSIDVALPAIQEFDGDPRL